MTGKFFTLSNVDTSVVELCWCPVKGRQGPVASWVPPSVPSFCSEARWLPVVLVLEKAWAPLVSFPHQLLWFWAACLCSVEEGRPWPP